MRGKVIGGVFLLATLVGAVLDLHRAGAYALRGLLLGASVAFLGLVMALLDMLPSSKHKLEKTVWTDRDTGRVVGESAWKWVGNVTLPGTKPPSKSLIGCLLLVPIVSAALGLLLASVANIMSVTLGAPRRFSGPWLH